MVAIEISPLGISGRYWAVCKITVPSYRIAWPASIIGQDEHATAVSRVRAERLDLPYFEGVEFTVACRYR
jgi:hypothetical protein